jgi:hypothetical protein
VKIVYGSFDNETLKILAIGTSKEKIEEFIRTQKPDDVLFTASLDENDELKISIEDMKPHSTDFFEIFEKINDAWKLLRLVINDVLESGTEIHIFERPKK